MLFLFVSWWPGLCLIISLILLYFYCEWVGSRYWKSRNVPHENAYFIGRTMCKAIINNSFQPFIDDIYLKWKKKKMVGFWAFFNPGLILTDVQLIQSILVKDFSSFQDHANEVNCKREPLAGNLA